MIRLKTAILVWLFNINKSYSLASSNAGNKKEISGEEAPSLSTDRFPSTRGLVEASVFVEALVLLPSWPPQWMAEYAYFSCECSLPVETEEYAASCAFALNFLLLCVFT